MAYIVSLIWQAMITDLKEALFSDDIVKAGVVKYGRLQDNPQDFITSALVHECDPDDAKGWPHQLAQQSQVQGPFGDNMMRGFFELGGSATYLRRFRVDLEIYLTQQDLQREEAKELIDLVSGRAFHALRNSKRIPGLTDQWGEYAIMCRHGVMKTTMVLHGGPPTSWIGRGNLWFQVHTQLT